MEPIKLCVDCKWCEESKTLYCGPERFEVTHHCSHENVDHVRDVVDGTRLHCYEVRSRSNEYHGWKIDLCGRYANWFEPKEAAE